MEVAKMVSEGLGLEISGLGRWASDFQRSSKAPTCLNALTWKVVKVVVVVERLGIDAFRVSGISSSGWITRLVLNPANDYLRMILRNSGARCRPHSTCIHK